ncbi:MAG TPA: prenyltransferase/squalene oxidase repeat-containing protein [Gemmataceae bacterium]|nr:prenyltransferase/squalene oxidase repeat-containing protein [Gemmataceae bacterium]
MLTRRQFLSRTGMLTLGAAGSALALAGDTPPESLPDGSASRGMITPQTEQAIERGLAYLNSRKLANGSFGTNQYAGNVAVTSLAALAFMAGGHQPGRGAYGQVVTDALKAVLAQEDRNLPGYLYSRATPHGPMYGHGFGTLFLAEVCGMVPDAQLRHQVRETLKRAVNVILKAQNAEGGWRYTPFSRDADISVTICQIMALRAARNAGVAVPKSQVDRCVEYVRRCQDKREGWFRYQAQGGGGPHQAFARTAAGVCALYSAGIYKGPEIDAGLKYLMQYKPNGAFAPRHDMHYFYGHYYAAQVMWTAGGDYWAQWFPAIRDELLARQRPEGFWPDLICHHYGTAMACIILQIPNNYLPILQK